MTRGAAGTEVRRAAAGDALRPRAPAARGALRPISPAARRAPWLLALAAMCASVAQAAAGTHTASLRLDPAKSSLQFTVSRPGEVVEGKAPELAGEVTLDPAHPGAGSSVVLRVVARALVTGNRLRDRKMRNSHLEVERFPEIVFRSTSIQVPEDKGALRPGDTRRALVEGTLSLHGIDRTILFPASIRYDDGSLSADGELRLRLTDHGIPIPRFLWMVLDDEVVVRFRFLATPAGGGPPGAAER